MRKYFFLLIFIFCAFFEKNYVFADCVQEFTLHEGQSLFISGRHLKGYGGLTSENEAVVSVSNGLITANLAGEAVCKITEMALDGTEIIKKYKIKVLPRKLMRGAFIEPNCPKCGETIQMSVITEPNVEQVKFLFVTKNKCVEKTSEKKIVDNEKRLMHKAQLSLYDSGEYVAKFQVKIGGVWNNLSDVFKFEIFGNSVTNIFRQKASDQCVEFIMAKEGFKSSISEDFCSKNCYDIGYGNVVKPGVPFFNNITRDEAKIMLLKRLNDGNYSRMLNDFIVQNNLSFSQNQFDALLSFTYNVGPAWMTKSDLREIIISSEITNCKSIVCANKSIGTVISNDGLRLREYPNTQSKILKVLKFNDEIEILNEVENGWVKVKTSNGKEGFCFKQFLSVNSDNTNSIVGVVNSDNGLKLRSAPNTTGKVIEIIKFNENVDILSDKYNNWYKVKTQSGKEGFCFAEFLTIKTNVVEKSSFKNNFLTEFLAYHNAGGKFVKGLLNRRVEELQIFFYNDYSCDGFKNKYDFPLPACS